MRLLDFELVDEVRVKVSLKIVAYQNWVSKVQKDVQSRISGQIWSSFTQSPSSFGRIISSFARMLCAVISYFRGIIRPNGYLNATIDFFSLRFSRVDTSFRQIGWFFRGIEFLLKPNSKAIDNRFLKTLLPEPNQIIFLTP